MPDTIQNINNSIVDSKAVHEMQSEAMSFDTSSLSQDTAIVEESHPAIVLIDYPRGRDVAHRSESATGMSWVILLFVVVFLLSCLNYKNNFKYIKSIVSDLTDVRSRNNMFDDTVRESTFLTMLNVMCVISVALLSYTAVMLANPAFSDLSFVSTIASIGGIAISYYLFQYAMYWAFGNIFGDVSKTSSWIKGFASSQGLLGVILFPLSLISFFYADIAQTVCIVAFILFVLARFVFIFKGFRIFFAQISSWLLFLYYLCSVEIIPMIFAYLLVVKVCKILI